MTNRYEPFCVAIATDPLTGRQNGTVHLDCVSCRLHVWSPISEMILGFPFSGEDANSLSVKVKKLNQTIYRI